MSKEEYIKVRCSFDPVTDICLLAEIPNGEQFWLAGEIRADKFSVVGEYIIPMIVSGSACEPRSEQVYQWRFCPLGKTAEQLKPYESTK